MTFDEANKLNRKIANQIDLLLAITKEKVGVVTRAQKVKIHETVNEVMFTERKRKRFEKKKIIDQRDEGNKPFLSEQEKEFIEKDGFGDLLNQPICPSLSRINAMNIPNIVPIIMATAARLKERRAP